MPFAFVVAGGAALVLGPSSALVLGPSAARVLQVAVASGAARHVAPRCGFLDGFMKAADDAVWDAFQGRKERKWSPDRRPADQRGRFDFSASSLSWGREGCDIDSEDPSKGCAEISAEVAETLRAVAETPSDGVSYEEDMRLLTDGRGGLAGEFSGRMAMYARIPGNPTSRVTSGRELAELCFAKYGRYHDQTILRNKVGGDRWQVLSCACEMLLTIFIRR